MKAFGTPVILNECSARFFDFDDRALVPWFDRPDADVALDEKLNQNDITQQEQQWFSDFVERGFIVVENLLEEGLINQINQDLDQVIAEKRAGYEYGASTRIEGLHRTLCVSLRFLRVICVGLGSL